VTAAPVADFETNIKHSGINNRLHWDILTNLIEYCMLSSEIIKDKFLYHYELHTDERYRPWGKIFYRFVVLSLILFV